MNKIKIMTIILVMVASLVGCSEEEQSGEILENKPSAITSKTINLTMMQPETINPITNKNKSVGYIMNLIYDSLFTIDENYDTVPQLVEAYNIANGGMAINIKLKDIKWHDGTILTSGDVKFTVDLIKQNIDSPYNVLIENISSISIINDKEFSINFKNKYAFSIDTLIFPIVSEKQLENSKNINNYKNNLVGNGAYKIKNYEERKNISLIINDGYYDQLPSTAKNIDVEIVPDEEAQVSMVISLDSDIAKISLDDLSKFHEKEFKTTTYESRDYECLLFNYDNEFFKDINFRKAITSSINKKKILEEGYINNATLINFPLNSKSKYYDKDIKTLEYSKENAKKYLSEVTLEANENINNTAENTNDNKNTSQDVNKSNLETNNKKDNTVNNVTNTEDDKKKEIKEQISKLNLKIIVNKDNSERIKSAYIISDNLKDIGIKNTIEELSSEDMSKALNEKNYDLALVGWELSLVPDSTNILESIGYEDEKLTNYINSLKNATTESQISDIYKSIQKYVNENALFMSLVIRDDYIVSNKRIEGKISPNSFDIYEGITNLDIAK
nr:ABC transporter substrate-binding protein [uncultured Romboutsia sp.]